jgi:replication factor A1
MVSEKRTTGKMRGKALRKNVSTGEYLAFLSIKYEVDPDRLFHALISAEENQKYTTGDLSIECRGKTQDKAMFLFLKDSKVVAQFLILKEFLLEGGNPIRSLMKTDMIRRYLAKKNRRSLSLPIRDLRSGMTQVCLKAKVLEIPKPNLVCTRYGNYASVANALIEDETGTIRLCLWNEQISCISKGDTIRIENARTFTFRGQRQLRIGKKGLLTNVDDSSRQLTAMTTS